MPVKEQKKNVPLKIALLIIALFSLGISIFVYMETGTALKTIKNNYPEEITPTNTLRSDWVKGCIKYISEGESMYSDPHTVVALCMETGFQLYPGIQVTQPIPDVVESIKD